MIHEPMQEYATRNPFLGNDGAMPALPREKNDRAPLDKRLGRLLRERRDSRKGTPDYISQEALAKITGIPQNTLSRIELGKKSLTDYSGDQTIALLLAYGFRTDEIEQVAHDYKLNWAPPRPAQSHELPLGGIVSVPYEGTISAPDDQNREYQTNEWFLRGHAPTHVRARFIGESDYATTGARARYSPNTYVLRHTSLEPHYGAPVILRSGDLEYLAIYGEPTTEPLLAFDPDLPKRRVDREPELVGTIISLKHYL